MSRPTLLSGCAIILLVLVAGCSPGPAPRQFRLTGQVVSVSPDGRQLVVHHDEIPGFMPGMTMPFQLERSANGKDRRPGDLISATLMVTDEAAWLARVEKTGWAPIREDAAAVDAGPPILQPGEPVPDETLIDQAGRPFRFSSLRGSSVVVTFVYTRCPLPEFCPRMDAYFAALQQALIDGRLRGPVRLLSVSFDPDFDTPAVLQAHAARVGARPGIWTFATAPADRVEAWGAHLGLSVIRDTERPSDITHNLRTAIVDPQGRLAAILEGNRWTVDEAIAAVRSSTH